MECRKRAVAGKVTPLDEIGIACLPAGTDLRRQGAAVATAVVPPFLPGSGRIAPRGARAPPLTFA